VLFYEPGPRIFIEDPLEVLAVWHGGLASHGGAIGIAIGLWLFQRKHKGYTLTWLFDRMAIVAAISGAFIRLGNLMNSEILGRATDQTWGIWFQRVDKLAIYRHPAQLYEAALCIVLFAFLIWRYQKGDALAHPGRLIGLFLVLLFVGRFVIEYYKEVQVDFESALPLDMGQILSIPFVLIGLVILVRSRNALKTGSKAV
jgi:prolipoprotein diacylglyceryl transferase